MYSSIEEASRREVIKKCYWPLFKLADMGIPIGIEAPGITLETIQEIDPKWIESLTNYIDDGKIEFIGSGYSQVIGPLVPSKVNEWNQKLGLDRYEKLLGIKPKLALVNEMAYSGGIVEHYVNADYEGLIMEWNNPRSAHPEWVNEWRYFSQKAIGVDGSFIPLIWADSIAFQKFQRFTHGEYKIEEYVDFIKSHIGESDRFFPLYSNDVEIFDYRPGRYHTEARVNDDSEWKRIIELYSHLDKQNWCEFIFPSDVLKSFNNDNGGYELKLESPVQPIPVKKQEKYNINRWALTGRDDLKINTKCYQIYNGLIKKDSTNPYEWKELCYLWSSDFRTHITEKRWIDYIKKLDNFVDKWNYNNGYERVSNSKQLKVLEDNKLISVENENYKIVLNKNKGLTIKKLILKNAGNKPLLGTLHHGYYDDISLGADYYSGHAVFERPGEHKVTDLGKVDQIKIESDNGVSLKTKQTLDDYTFSQNIFFQNKKITIEKNIETNFVEKVVIHPFSFTFCPEAWDRESLYIATHSGGNIPTQFFLKGQNISHGDIYSSLISARHGFGNTEGLFFVCDKNKTITFQCDMGTSALIPSIVYKEMDDSIFFRLQYSAREIDETIIFKRPRIRKITAIVTVSRLHK
jgi:hypothetical protein